MSVTAEQAVELLQDCVTTSSQHAIRMNTSKQTKTSGHNEKTAYIKAFAALVGRKPTSEEIEKIVTV